jgi:hypothetical protein
MKTVDSRLARDKSGVTLQVAGLYRAHIKNKILNPHIISI